MKGVPVLEMAALVSWMKCPVNVCSCLLFSQLVSLGMGRKAGQRLPQRNALPMVGFQVAVGGSLSVGFYHSSEQMHSDRPLCVGY